MQGDSELNNNKTNLLFSATQDPADESYEDPINFDFTSITSMVPVKKPPTPSNDLALSMRLSNDDIENLRHKTQLDHLE